MKTQSAAMVALFFTVATAAVSQDDTSTIDDGGFSKRGAEPTAGIPFDAATRQDDSTAVGADPVGHSQNQPPLAVPQLNISVLQPEGEPAADALVVLWNNSPIELTQLPAWNQPMAKALQTGVAPVDASTAFQGVTKEDGSLSMDAVDVKHPGSAASLERGFLVWHSSGYATDAVVPPPTDDTIRLRPFGAVDGICTIDGVPPKECMIVATWQSFPMSPALQSISPDQMQNVPPLFQLRVVTAIDESGKFRFEQLPPGRIQFELRHGSPVPGLFEQPSTTNLRTWATVTEGENAPLALEYRARAITGRLKLNDAIYEDLTAVVARPGGGASVQRKKAAVMLSKINQDIDGLASFGTPLTPNTSNDHDSSNRTFELVRAAAVWGRPGGRREQQEFVVMAPVTDDGRFMFAAIKPGEYSASLMVEGTAQINVGEKIVASQHMWAMIREDIFEIKPTHFDPAGIIPAGGTPHVIDLGEIELRDAPSGDTFGDATFIINEDNQPSGAWATQPQSGNDGRYFGTPGQPPVQPRPFSEPPLSTPAEVPDFPGTAVDPATNLKPTIAGVPAGHSDSFFAVETAGPETVARVQPAVPVDPLDREIATLVARLIAAGDQSTKMQLLKPLESALTRQFDAEQQSREALIRELEARIQSAKERVSERSRNKAQFIRKKLQGLLNISDDTLFSAPTPGVNLLPDDIQPPTLPPELLPEPASPFDPVPMPSSEFDPNLEPGGFRRSDPSRNGRTLPVPELLPDSTDGFDDEPQPEERPAPEPPRDFST